MSGDRTGSRMRRLYALLRRRVHMRWNRVLPFSETLVDRWEKAKFLGFGEGSSIYDSACVYGNVRVGANTWVGPNVILDGTGGLEIGDHCSISAGVQIYSHNTVKWAVSGGRDPYEHKPVRIGRCCFIGPGVIVKNGVTIGDHCVVGAGSFVSRDLPAFSISAGQPARIIGSVHLQEDGSASLVYGSPAP